MFEEISVEEAISTMVAMAGETTVKLKVTTTTSTKTSQGRHHHHIDHRDSMSYKHFLKR